METGKKRFGSVLFVVVALFALIPAILAAAVWNPVESAAQDNDNQEFDWSGTITRDGSNEKYVCLVFEGEVFPDQVCSALLTDAETAYACSLPFADINTHGASVKWEIIHAPNTNCAGYGTQDPSGDSGTISPTAVTLASFGAGKGAAASLILLILASMAVAGLIIGIMAYRSRLLHTR